MHPHAIQRERYTHGGRACSLSLFPSRQLPLAPGHRTTRNTTHTWAALCSRTAAPSPMHRQSGTQQPGITHEQRTPPHRQGLGDDWANPASRAHHPQPHPQPAQPTVGTHHDRGAGACRACRSQAQRSRSHVYPLIEVKLRHAGPGPRASATKLRHHSGETAQIHPDARDDAPAVTHPRRLRAL